MPLIRSAAALATVFFVAIGTCHAATEDNFTGRTTGDLVTLCDPQSDSALDNAGVNYCEGFVQGSVLVEQEHEASKRSRQFFCLPDPAPTRNEAMAAFVKWARASPDRLAMPAVDGLISFLRDQYPCPKGR